MFFNHGTKFASVSTSTGPSHGKIVVCALETEFTTNHSIPRYPLNYDQANLNLCTHVITKDFLLKDGE